MFVKKIRINLVILVVCIVIVSCLLVIVGGKNKYYKIYNLNDYPSTLAAVLTRYNINTGNKMDVFLPVNTANIAAIMKEIPYEPGIPIGIIQTSDDFVLKVNHMNFDTFTETWSYPEDSDKLSSDKLYIYKSDSNSNVSVKPEKNTCIAQELIESIKYNGHKIAFKLFMLVLQNEIDVFVYVYNDGTIVYANKDSIHARYTDSMKLYANEDFPLLISESEYSADYTKMRDLCSRFAENIFPIIEHSCKVSGITFQLFELTYVIDTNREVFLVDISNNPMMEPVAKKDREFRESIYTDILGLLGLGDTERFNGFTKVAEYPRDI